MRAETMARQIRRRIERASQARAFGAQTAALNIPVDFDAPEFMQQEIERQRDALAERLLEIAAESWQPDWQDIAEKALAAAAVIHPDVPGEEDAGGDA